MSPSAIDEALSTATDGLRLLDHPYYRAWQTGELRPQDLKGYAEQYRHFEACLPEVLAAAAAGIAQGDRVRDLLERNLSDELSNPRPHIDLFDGFGEAVGAAGGVEATPATSELVRLYRDAAEAGVVQLLAVVGAYECQAADIAATKATALAELYDLGPAGTEFWRVHASIEDQHANWTAQALDALGAGEDEVAQWAGRSARAWWAFLDERDAARAA